jgi:hypothetical protein
MKKLIQLLEANIKVSSLNCANVNVDNDSSNDNVNENLLNDICKAAKSANVRVTITTAVSGHDVETESGNTSRHPSGNAVDISLINEIPVKTPSNRGNVDNFVNQLEILGYTKNSEPNSSVPKSVLTFGFRGHDNHVHVSNIEQSASTSSSGTTSSSGVAKTDTTDDSVGMNILNNFIGDTFGKALGLREQRVNKEISKIRNLLK